MRNSVSVCSFNLNSVFMRNIKHLSLLKSLFVCLHNVCVRICIGMGPHMVGRSHVERPEDSLECQAFPPALFVTTLTTLACLLLVSWDFSVSFSHLPGGALRLQMLTTWVLTLA